MSLALDFYKLHVSDETRVSQAETLDVILEEHFNFETIEFIETGVSSGNYDNFGLYFGKLVEQKKGIYSTVDISEKHVQDASQFFKKTLPELNPKFYIDDSISFLKSYEGSPNLLHLDSYDLHIEDPIPSMIHHWLEFDAIKDKMPSGSIVIIDDNYMKGTIVYWNIYDQDKNLIEVHPTPINYDMIGKGALIFFAIKDGKLTDWEILGNHYVAGVCVKLILKKK